jgi:YHS domain-containing protein
MTIATLSVIFVSGGIWFVPHRLLAQTNAPAADQKIVYYTCAMHPSVRSDKPGSCPICGMELVAVHTNIDATTNISSNGTNSLTTTEAKPKPYPFDTCLVDGMRLDSMGKPYVFVYQGQEIKLCCADCKSKFLNDPNKCLKKIKDAEGEK